MLGWLKENAIPLAVGVVTGIAVDHVIFKSEPEVRYLPAPESEKKKKKGKKNKKAEGTN